MQGTTATNGRWYLSSTGGSGPRLQAAKGGSGNTGVLTAEGPNRKVAQGVEDLSYWPGRDELWTVTEQPCTRYLYALPRERAATVDTSKPITCEQKPSGS